VSEETVPIFISHIQFPMFSSMQLLCFYQQPPSLFAVHTNGGIFKDKRFIINPYSSSSLKSCFGIVHASVKEDSQSQQYEVEPEKAREALKKLDEQMQSLSTRKQPSNNAPKLKGTFLFHPQSIAKISNFFFWFEIFSD